MLNQDILNRSRRRLSLLAGEERLAFLALLLLGLALVCLGWVLPLITYERLLQLLMAATVAGVALFYLIRKPPIAALALVLTCLTIGFEMNTGTNSRLNAAILFAPVLPVIWLLDALIVRRHLSLAKSRTLLPIFLFGLTAVLSFIQGLFWSTEVRAPVSAQLAGLAVILLSAGVFFSVAHQITELRWLKRLTWLFVAIGSLSTLLLVLLPSVVGSVFLPRTARGSTGSLFWVWLISLTFSQALCNRALSRQVRITLMAASAVTLSYVLTLSSWLSGWVPAFFALMVILWLARPILGAVATTLGVVLLSWQWQSLADKLMTQEGYSYVTRLEAWRIVANLAVTSPLLGFGPANYYHYVRTESIMGWFVPFSSHNQYVDIFAQTGILGLICFFWFVFEIGRVGWALRRRTGDGFAQAYVLGAIGGLAGTLIAGMLADWLLPFVYNIGVSGFRASLLAWIFMGGLVGLEQMTKASRNDRGIGVRVNAQPRK